jgi:hypothetical protein
MFFRSCSVAVGSLADLSDSEIMEAVASGGQRT